MEDKRFQEGQKLQCLYWGKYSSVKVGICDVKEIIVVIENGQMEGVPWAEVITNSGEKTKYNLALCEGVKILKL